jgi:hypothetical protein
LLLSLICRLHHLADGLPFQLQQPVNRSKNKSTFDVTQNPHPRFGAGSDFKSAGRKRRFERADLLFFGPHFLNGCAADRKVEIETFGALSARARNR